MVLQISEKTDLKKSLNQCIVTVCSHMYNTLVQHTRCTDRCIMQIRNPVVCDASKGSLL